MSIITVAHDPSAHCVGTHAFWPHAAKIARQSRVPRWEGGNL